MIYFEKYSFLLTRICIPDLVTKEIGMDKVPRRVNPVITTTVDIKALILDQNRKKSRNRIQRDF